MRRAPTKVRAVVAVEALDPHDVAGVRRVDELAAADVEADVPKPSKSRMSPG